MALQGKFDSAGLYEVGYFFDPDQDEEKTVTSLPIAKPTPFIVEAFRFAGKNAETALVLAGVHSKTEPEGVTLATSIKEMLIQKASKGIKPLFNTIVIPCLFNISRYGRGGNNRQVFIWDIVTKKRKAVTGKKNYTSTVAL
jgi:hypothetical protein